MAETRTMRTPVLIVGGGPVGLALAGELGWRGISCVLVEKSDGSIYQPKQDLVGIRTMEFCRRWGIVPWVEASPYPRHYQQDNVYVSAVAGFEFGREKFPGMAEEKAPPQSPQHRERCPQDMFDPILARFAKTFPHVGLRYHRELLSFSERAEGVEARVADPRTGEEEIIHCDYLVGCDGGGSVVRQGLGIAMSGNPVLTYTTNAIFRCPDFLALHGKGEAYRYIVIGPEGTFATIVAINGADRFRFSIVGDAEKREYGAAEMRAAIVKAFGREFDFDILTVVPWIRRELVAENFGANRVFIAGDAAHMISPTGGFGMNMGIQDVVDLAWKLAAMLGGWGGKRLLDSYSIERRPVAVRNVREASGNLNRMLSPRAQKPAPEAFEPGPAGDLARKEFGARFAAIMRREWFTLGIHLGYRYEASPVIVPDGTPEPPDEVSIYTQTARPGHRAPHHWLAPEKSTLDLYGKGFVLVRFAGAAAERLAAAAEQRRIPLAVVDIDDRKAAELYERPLVLVRPDGHVAWRGDGDPADAASVIDTVRGV
jgi:2-polyprenyl-6-methoxyphenol hydroxylase-like FAD-dependent oxidoreductase